MEVSLQHITDKLREFSEQHFYLNSFVAQEVSDFHSNDLVYPLLWCMPDAMETGPGELVFTISCMVLDRSEGVETVKLLSDTALVVEDLNTIFNDNLPEYGFNVDVINRTIKPVLDDLSGDKVTGWRFMLRAKVGSSLNETVVPRV